jgi:hypothetical protein
METLEGIQKKIQLLDLSTEYKSMGLILCGGLEQLHNDKGISLAELIRADYGELYVAGFCALIKSVRFTLAQDSEDIWGSLDRIIEYRNRLKFKPLSRSNIF